jgi:hypothetical protein
MGDRVPHFPCLFDSSYFLNLIIYPLLNGVTQRFNAVLSRK